MLKQQYTSIDAFHVLTWIPPKDQFVQIKNLNKNNWTALSFVCGGIFDISGGKGLPKST